MKAGLLLPQEINWPVLSSENFSSKKWLYLMINIQGYPHHNFRGQDALLMNLLCSQVQSAVEKYYLTFKAKENIMRSLKVLSDMRPILAETNHARL